MNVLKAVELQGFKSFASKTVLEFHDRVVAIVGPNGSGKSNIIDALRWALGEREAKQLRGDTQDNLIFAGTPKRAAVGMAKVSLVFNNASRIFGLDTEEVVVARKIDRSGVSEYFLNDEEIKLKELTPVLAKARLGTRGLTMIGQGQSDLFIKSSPADRRFMIEEVLGLREYRIKKLQAERRLLSSEQNIEKLRAMQEELEPHLKFLRRQKSRYEKRAEVEVALKETEDAYFALRLQDLSGKEVNYEEPVKRLTELLFKSREIIRTQELEVNKLDKDNVPGDESRKLQSELSMVLQGRSELERSAARIEAKIEMQRSSQKAATRTALELTEFLENLKHGLSAVVNLVSLDEVKMLVGSWIVKIDSLFKSEPVKDDETLVYELKQLNSRVSELSNRINEIREQEEAVRRSAENKRQDFRRAVEKLEREKNAEREHERELERLKFEAEKINIRLNDLKSQWHSYGRTDEDFSKLQGMVSVVKSNAEPGELEHKCNRLRAELSAIGEIDVNTLTEATETELRYESLTRDLNDLVAAKNNLATLITDLDTRIHADFKNAFAEINEKFNAYFALMFGGGKAQLKLKQTVEKPEGDENEGTEIIVSSPVLGSEESAGIEIELSLPKKRITNLSMLSGGEKSLVSLSALFALISVSPPPFLVLDEIDAPLDEANARRFAELIKEFSKEAQFIVITHNRMTMEVADSLYGITMGDDGVSKVLSMHLGDKIAPTE